MLSQTRINRSISLFLILSLLLNLPLGFVQINARSSQEIADEIEQEQERLLAIQKEISDNQNRIKTLDSQISSTSSELPRLKAEIEKLDSEFTLLDSRIKQNESEISLLDLELEKQEANQKKLYISAYKRWRIDKGSNLYLPTASNYIYYSRYEQQVNSWQRDVIGELYDTKVELDAKIIALQDSKAEVEDSKRELEESKRKIEARIASLQGSYAGLAGNVAGLRSQVGQIQENIGILSSEQSKALEYEKSLLINDNGNGGTQQVDSGEFYFESFGRDLYQGHGVGLSQFGAYGAANNGMNYQQILSMYYRQTVIQTRPGNVNVQGYGSMNLNTYAAGIGEVPSKACGTAQQVSDRPDKYILDNPSTVWDCWPEEAIKAQIIAARSYAASYNGTVCTTAACQVYIGGNAKQWVADETRDMVIVSTGSTHNGQVIQALYSSDNNQGYGTANNDTVFSNLSGDGTPYSYLRHVDDSNTSHQFLYTNWVRRTNSYSLEDIENMLSYVNRNSSLSYARSHVNSAISSIGGLSSLEFERGPSNRIKKVWLVGNNGSRRAVAGWLFKNIWNSWVADEKPSGEIDYIYSLTFFKRDVN